MKNWIKSTIPHIVALLIFAVASALFFRPQYMGMVLSQTDIIQASGMSADIEDHIQKYGEHPQWSGRDFGGMPAYLINMNYDGRYVKELSSIAYFLGQPAALLWIAMTTFYMMLCLMGVNPWIAIAGGLGYGLSAYFPQIILAGHITKMMALAWIPALIGAIWYAYRKNRYLGASMAGIFAAIEISTSHPQITYYFLFVILALVINELVVAVKSKKVRDFLLTSSALLIAAILAVGANAVQLYYVADHTPETTRGVSELKNTKESNPDGGLEKDYAMAWSYGKSESFNMFIPSFKGQGSGSGFAKDGAVAKSLRKYQVPSASQVAQSLPSYWGDQPFTIGPVYVGAILIFLALFGIFLIGVDTLWVIIPSIFALMLAWGSNLDWFNDIIFKYLPLYNKFRTPSMALVVLEWSIPFLAAMGITKLIKNEISRKKFWDSIYLSFGICGGFALIVAFIMPSILDFVSVRDYSLGLPDDILSAMQSERASLLKSDALRSLLFSVIGMVILAAFYVKKISFKWICTALIVFVVCDLWIVDKRMVNEGCFSKAKTIKTIEPTDADKLIMRDTSNYRVANLMVGDLFSDATTSYFHRSVGGYHAAKLRRYKDIIDMYLTKMDIGVYSMLNTKYFITKDGVSINDRALGNAWFVDSICWVDTPDDEIASLDENKGFDARRVAVVDEKFKIFVDSKMSQADSTSSIDLVDYRVNRLTYKSKSNVDGVAVFSEIYYPKGWTVTVDGKIVDYYRANYILRAMNIPYGEHTIVWSFAAPHFGILKTVTGLSSILLLLSVVIFGYIEIRKYRMSYEN